MKLLKCVAYLALISVISFFAGRLMPKSWLKPDAGLFRCFAFEKQGSIYEKLGIRRWHKRLPDISRILPFMMPAKNLSGDFAQRLPIMIRETCVAEAVHIGVSIFGFRCLWLWPGAGGVSMTALYILLNLPFILIQRYNRPRLLRLQKKLLLQKKEETVCAS